MSAFTNQPIVIDNGSGLIKAGFAGDNIPKCHFPNFVGRPKWSKVMASGLEGDVFIGEKAVANRGLMQLRYPMESGVITDWQDMERIWRMLYTKDFLNTRSEEHPVLLTEAPNNPSRQREKAAEIFFETFNVPALHFSVQALLSLYATGRTTGLVLDVGDGVTHAVPVFDGYSVAHGVTRTNVAGRQVTNYLRWLLQKEGYDFITTAELEVVREIKVSIKRSLCMDERMRLLFLTNVSVYFQQSPATIQEQSCFLLENTAFDDASGGHGGGLSGGAVVAGANLPSLSSSSNSAAQRSYIYQLPDGNSIAVGKSRWKAPELLFKPSVFGYEEPGVHEVLMSSIRRVDLDCRKSFYSNIVLSGGSTLFKGFGDRLLYELKKEVPEGCKIRITAPQERLYSCWIGGSILAALGTWRRMWITREEWSEHGTRAIGRKSFV